MEVRQLRIAALPVLIALFGVFALSIAASSGLSGAKLWTTASKDLIDPGLSLKFSNHGLMTQVSISKQTPQQPTTSVDQGKSIISGVRSDLMNEQLDSSASAVR